MRLFLLLHILIMSKCVSAQTKRSPGNEQTVVGPHTEEELTTKPMDLSAYERTTSEETEEPGDYLLEDYDESTEKDDYVPLFGYNRQTTTTTTRRPSANVIKYLHFEFPKNMFGGTFYSNVPKHFIPVMIRITEDRYCGGTLINGLHILTAAHCFFRPKTICTGDFNITRWRDALYDKNQIVIEAGGNCVGCSPDTNLPRYPAQTMRNIVELVVIPKRYVISRCRRSDIAVVRVTTLLASNFDMRIPYYMSKPINGNLTAAGYGFDPNERESKIRYLSKIDVKLQKCEGTNVKEVICMEEKESNVCQGDSGGGLLDFVPYHFGNPNYGYMTVYGVVSHGTSCKLMHALLEQKRAGLDVDTNFKGGFFTSTYYYAPFICKATLNRARLDGNIPCARISRSAKTLVF
ncbi:hypothetical protein QR680_010004 [Steinernema hermaphroditum]|uniref:Peptidase S1 domain-containing protein n=1 Tax=Steinernema hermaphroditum TaxID=289476 RepID=A0AA39MAX7_9BILA|nr:hypothetical protein QR680_010004 [Steinernema hermaphroditum]